jgi:hypothetical protein
MVIVVRALEQRLVADVKLTKNGPPFTDANPEQ